jgi:hypothetical protein
MGSYATMLEGAYTAFADECRREMARLRAARAERNARTREALAALRRALAEGEPFLAAQGFLVVDDEPDPEIAEESPRAAPGLSIADATSRQVVTHVTVEDATYSITQPLLSAEPYVASELGDVVTRVGQILARHRCAETGDVPTPTV